MFYLHRTLFSTSTPTPSGDTKREEAFPDLWTQCSSIRIQNILSSLSFLPLSSGNFHLPWSSRPDPYSFFPLYHLHTIGTCMLGERPHDLPPCLHSVMNIWAMGITMVTMVSEWILISSPPWNNTQEHNHMWHLLTVCSAITFHSDPLHILWAGIIIRIPNADLAW